MSDSKKRDYVLPGLGAVLRAARTAKGLSLSDVQKASGVDRAGLSLYERDIKAPTLPILAKLATTYGVTICELLPVDQQPALPPPVPPAAPAPASARKRKAT